MYKLLEDGFGDTVERKTISSALLWPEKKKREKSFFKYLRHEGLWAVKPLHLKDIPENNLNTCLVYTYGMGGREALSPLDWIGDHPLSLRPENYLKTRLVYM